MQTIPSELPKLFKLHMAKIQERYMVDMNPNAKFKNKQVNNVIDGRFIDTLTGHFIDITVVGSRHEITPELFSW